MAAFNDGGKTGNPDIGFDNAAGDSFTVGKIIFSLGVPGPSALVVAVWNDPQIEAGSNKCRFLGGLKMEKGTPPVVGMLKGPPADIGRFNELTSFPGSILRLSLLSAITAPAVLGLVGDVSFLRVVERERRPALAEGGLDVPALVSDDMLPDNEWLRRIVAIELEVSEEIVESGRGMNSNVSEKPTLARGCLLSFLGPETVPTLVGDMLSKGAADAVLRGTSTSSKAENARLEPGSKGVVGALSPRVRLLGSTGLTIVERSWQEIAPDRR